MPSEIQPGMELVRRVAAAGEATSRLLALRVEFPDRGDELGALFVEFGD